MEVHTVLWTYMLCYKSIHYAIKNILYYEITHRAMDLHSVIWKYTLFYKSTHCAMELHTVLWKYTPWYESTHYATKIQTVL